MLCKKTTTTSVLKYIMVFKLRAVLMDTPWSQGVQIKEVLRYLNCGHYHLVSVHPNLTYIICDFGFWNWMNVDYMQMNYWAWEFPLKGHSEYSLAFIEHTRHSSTGAGAKKMVQLNLSYPGISVMDTSIIRTPFGKWYMLYGTSFSVCIQQGGYCMNGN